jgi:chromosome segregation ATPase
MFDDMRKGSLKNIDMMVSALQDLSEGKGIAANTFWQLVEFDTEGLLNGAKLVGDKFIITEENMIKLKDKYIQKQIDELKIKQATFEIEKANYEQDVARYEIELARLTLEKKLMTSKEFQTTLRNLEMAKEGAKAYGDQWERINWLIEYLNQTLGNTVDLQKQLETQQKQLNKELTALNKQLDNYQKAYETKIDGIIKGLEAEENELENQKQVLEDELDILEKQKDTIEETLDNYEKVNSYAQKIIDKEIKSLEEQRDAIKNTYDERINALKEENSEREDALDYAQKLANLENAKNNKRRVYDEARGWRYESVKEDVVKAESDLKSFETNQQVKKLEKERDAEIKAWDALIKKKEDYKKQWTEWLEELQDEESEALMLQYLGADAREKIANGDLELIETFSTQYRIHNNDLKRLTDTEIKLKKAEIEAKEADIKASKERIQAWKDYKQQFSIAVNDIKAANEDYMKQIGTIELDETSSLERRQGVFETFKNNVSGYIDQIGAKQGEIDKVTAALDEIQGGTYSINFEVENLDDLKTARDILDEIKKSAEETGEAILHWGDKGWAGHDNEYWGMPSHANGGVVNYTGVAMLHGSQQHPETIFNAKDSAKLYDMVHNTPNLMANMLSQAHKLSGFKLSSNENTTNATANTNIYIDKIVTDNPESFAHQLDRYYRTKLTESYTSRQ